MFSESAAGASRPSRLGSDREIGGDPSRFGSARGAGGDASPRPSRFVSRGGGGGGGRAGGGAAHADAEHAQATEKLRVVSERLRGVYNVRVPRASVWARHRDPVERAGSDAPLSVPGQVQRLIQEATDPENLCQMYMGWMPWC